MFARLDEMLKEPARAISHAVIENVSRRSFLKTSAALTGFVMAVRLVPTRDAAAFEAYPTGADGMPNGTVNDPHIFVSIAEDGTVSIMAHRAEMGTGAKTMVPMVLADEMEALWENVVLVQAPGDEPRYGNQDTDGSRSMRHFIQPMRECGAAMRAMLERAAAAQWGADPALCRAKAHAVHLMQEQVAGEGVILIETGQSLGYGELANAAMALDTPARDELRFKTADEFTYMGKGNVQISDLFNITTGKAIYGADVRLPGMKYAAVARPPVVGGKVVSFNADAARAVPGVEDVIELEGSIMPAKFAPLGGVAVIASNTWAAFQGRDALEIEWDDGPHASYNSAEFRAEMEKTALEPGKVFRRQGDPDSAFANAASTFGQSYYQPHMAHAPMEPPVGIAQVANGKAEVWAPVQSPYGTRQDVATTLGLEEADVTVNVTLLGGGFGRKSKCDYVLEAALLSQQIGGAPVKVAWSREDDIQHSFYHTVSVERIEVALDADKKVTGWRHNSVAPSILSTFAPDDGHQFFIEQGMGHVDNPFEIANMSIENGAALAHTRIGWFRAVSNIPRAFAVQSFVAELAHELGKDPRDMLLEMIGSDRQIDPRASGFPEDWWNYGEPEGAYPIDTARMKHVVNLAAEKIGWGKEMPAREGLGIAVHRSFVTYVATAVHVKVDSDGTVHVPEVHTAIDCGFPVHPERIRSQTEGAAVMGMTLAMHSGITFENGRAQQSNFHDYEMVRITNFPARCETHIVPHPFEVHASGVGEPGVPPFAPALCNAIFAATGKRIRDLPIAGHDLSDA